MDPAMEHFRVERQPDTPGALIAYARLSGEGMVRFNVEILDSVRKKVDERGWYAVPNLIILQEMVDTSLTKAVGSALMVERSYSYRPWQGMINTTTSASSMHKVEYYGDLEWCGKSGWIDVAVTTGGGMTFTLTIETPASIQNDLTEEGDASFYCPDLVIVQRIEPDLIERAVAALVTDDISKYGILSTAVQIES